MTFLLDPTLVVIGLGSNLGNRRSNIKAAAAAIADLPGIDQQFRDGVDRNVTNPRNRTKGRALD